MTVSIQIELSDQDLKHFDEAMKSARQAATSRSEAEVIESTAELLKNAQAQDNLPDFIARRLERLDAMVAMLRDEAWALPAEDRQRVVSALVYFADPSDVIPDHVPVLGFLDDAIMIELCQRELTHEIEAYEDFCEFREHEASMRGKKAEELGRAEFLEGRREELLDRMHRRRERDFGVGYGNSSGYGRRGSYANAWRPGVLRVR